MTNKQKLIELKFNWLKSQHPNLPEFAIPKPKYSDTTANGLTKMVIDWLQLNGYQAERVNNTGQYRDKSKIVTDVMGFKRKIGSGQWTKGSGTVGTADIHATIKNSAGYGISVKIEIKMKDKQSTEQKSYQEHIERSGGVYWLVHSFDEFCKFYFDFIK